MRGLRLGIVFGAVVLGGCGTRSTGVMETAPGTLGVAVSGSSLPAATERGLREATAHCASLGRQTQILGTQMGRDEYQVAFRCTGRVAAAPPQPEPAPQPLPLVLLSPEAAPVLSGEAFVGRPVPPGPAAPRTAVVPSAAPVVPGVSLSMPPAGFFARPAPVGAASLPPVAGTLGLRRD